MGIGEQLELEKTGRIESEIKQSGKQNGLRIENWSLVASSWDPYRAPEQVGMSIQGEVYNHPRFRDGKSVITSTIVGKRGNKVITYSGSHYSLGEPAEMYEKTFPGAKKRTMDALKEM